MATAETTLHELCKGFGALLSRSKQPGFIEESARMNDRGNLPLHAACSFQASLEVIETLLKAYPGAASQPNNVGNLPIHQAAMWQAPAETVEILLSRYPEGATVRNQYGSLPLHMAASNQASSEVVKLLIEAYPDAVHLQNDDGMTPLDLALSDESASETVVALLEGRPAPPEMSRRQKAEKLMDRADALERKLSGMKDMGGRQGKDVRDAIMAVRRLADRFPHALYSAGIDPNELEIALSGVMEKSVRGRRTQNEADLVILDAVKRRAPPPSRVEKPLAQVISDGNPIGIGLSGPRDRVEDLLNSIVGLDHIKSQVRGLRRSTEIADLRESLLPSSSQGRGGINIQLLQPALSESSLRPRVSHLIFVGNPGTGKTAVARLLAKCYHELGVLRKPKFLEVERMDLVGISANQTAIKTREVIEEAKGGILFIDEAYTLAMSTKKSTAEAGLDAINELTRSIDMAEDDSFPIVVLSGFPSEMQNFLASQGTLRKRFALTFEFPDYTCEELAQIFVDLAISKGCHLDDSITIKVIATLLERETTPMWRSERNGRICELLLAGARAEIRKRMRTVPYDDTHFDPQLIIRSDLETVMREEFK